MGGVQGSEWESSTEKLESLGLCLTTLAKDFRWSFS